MKRLFLILIFLSSVAYAQEEIEVCRTEEEQKLDCGDSSEVKKLIQFSSKLPTNCLKLKVMNEVLVQDQDDRRWKVRFYFGNTRNTYYLTDIKLKTSNMDVKISGMMARERSSDSYFKFWEPKGGVDTWFQWIDEPNNTFKLAIEKKGNEFFLSIFHPKYTFVQGGVDDQNTNVLVQGTVNGNQVNGYQHIKGAFDSNGTPVPDQIHLTKWENSHYFLNWEVGYGKVIPLIKSGNKPIVKWTPQVSAGIFTGVNNSGQLNAQGEPKYYESTQFKMMGVSGTIGNRISITNKKDNIGAFVEHRYYLGKLKYDWGDGTAEHMMRSSSFTFGVQVGLFKVGRKPGKIAVPQEETQLLE